jgi:hypothetical protein
MVEHTDGISVFRHHKSLTSIIDVQMTFENISTLNKLSNNTVSPLLVDFSEFTNINPLYTPTARKILLDSDFTVKRSAIAFLFNDSDQIKMSFQYQNSNRLGIPIKLFAHSEEAMMWLKTFIPN